MKEYKKIHLSPKIEEYSLNFLKHKYKKILYLRRYGFVQKNNLFLKLYDNLATDLEYFAIEPETIFNLYDCFNDIENQSDIGYIYIIKNNGYYKIGKTIYLDKRVNTYYRTENPNPYTLIFSKKVYFHSSVEKELHLVFEGNNYNREWFSLNDDNLRTAKRLLNIFSVC
jgi:hypothetical protein